MCQARRRSVGRVSVQPSARPRGELIDLEGTMKGGHTFMVLSLLLAGCAPGGDLPGGECLGDEGCSAIAYCDVTTRTCQFKQPQACDADDECFSDHRCAPETRTCLKACRDTEQCVLEGSSCQMSASPGEGADPQRALLSGRGRPGELKNCQKDSHSAWRGAICTA